MNRTRHIKKLSEICNLITDGVHNSPKYVESGIPMLDSKHINDNFFIDDQKPTKFISQETDNLLSKRCKPLANDLLISSRGSIGKIAIVREGQNFNIMGNIILLRLLDNVSSKYIAFSLQSKLDEIQSISRGVAQKGLYLNQVRNFEVALPPLHEQERIVAIVDNAFEGIDRTIANTKKNLTNARELFESYLNAIFTQKGDGWEEKTLREVSLDFGRGKSKHRPRNDPKLYGGSYPFIQTGDVRNCNHVITECSQFYSEAGLTQSKLWTKGTICITIAANIAETGILGFDACFPDSVIGIVVNNELTSNEFVEYLLQAVKARIKAKGKGSAQDNINLATFENEKFPFPSLDQQSVIVDNLNQLSSETQRLEAIYRQKLAALNELKQTILQRAFTGELTADTANQATKTAEGAIAA